MLTMVDSGDGTTEAGLLGFGENVGNIAFCQLGIVRRVLQLAPERIDQDSGRFHGAVASMCTDGVGLVSCVSSGENPSVMPSGEHMILNADQCGLLSVSVEILKGHGLGY